MSFFPWSDEYSVHLRVIDNDHKDLVNTVNALHDAISGGGKRGEIGRIIGTLAQYVDEHFLREEVLMESHAYPDIADHKRIHRHLARQVYAIRTIFASKPQLIDPAKLLRFLRDWLVHHILEEDRKYVPFLRGAAAQSMPAAEPSVSPSPARGTEDEEMETLSITVPASKAAVLRRCARFLAEDGVEAISIEDLVMPIGHMTYDEAVHFARPILRKDGGK
jgi:hemerythrin